MKELWEINLRIRTTIGKGKNIVYYRTLDQTLRLRATYIHVLRSYRKELVGLLSVLPTTDEYKGYRVLFNRLISVIDPKVKTKDCSDTIIKIKKIFEDYGN